MRRWLTALIALHFFVCVGFFVNAHASTLPGPGLEQASQQLSELLSPPRGDDLQGHTPDQGLSDPPTESPEWLVVADATLPASPALATPTAPLRPPVEPPALEGPQRPPPAVARV
ncbi:hypothetical protein [Hydrogenophaga defluvii]|uniref:Uncharacterized protein n=1 Tax=Hydrogenophaga defluvii TaxID=249410 RepID=A0ABW2SH48_9BURK